MASRQEENAALVREFLTNVVASCDTDTVGIFPSEGTVDHRPASDSGVESETVGPGYWRALAAADIHITVDDVVVANESVTVREPLSRHHRESLHDWESIRHSSEIAIAWFYRIENGQILETWSLPSGPWLVQQFDTLLRGT